MNNKFSFIDSFKDSSIHGISHLAKSTTNFKRIIWSLFLLSSTSLSAFLIIESFKNYFSFEVITNIRVKNEIQMIFPCIVICNKNVFPTLNAKNYLDQVMKNHPYLKIDDIDTLASVALSLLKEESREIKKTMSLPFEEFILSCNFKGMNCTTNDFEWFFDFSLGNCYKYNCGKDSDGKSQPPKYITKPGIINRLFLELNVGVEYNFYEYNGVRILIKNDSTSIDMTQGIDLATGTKTNLVLSKSYYNNLPFPYSDCKTNIQNKYSIIDRSFIEMNVTYNQFDCFNLCFQLNVISKCGCYLPYYYKMNSSIECSVADRECVENKIMKNENVYSNCPDLCPLECEYVKYGIISSFNSFPTKTGYRQMKDYLKYLEQKNLTFDYQKAKDSLLRISIYFDELKILEFSENAKMTITDLLSNCGGVLGLMLGISFLSFVEIVEVLFDFLNYLHKKHRKIQNK